MSEKIIDRNYGSIPHMQTSKLSQQADKKMSPQQESLLTKKARDWKDMIVVTEKLDGSNVGVIRKGGKLIPLSRSGYSADTSPYEQHQLFSKYVKANGHMFEWLEEGCRIVGEWCAEACGTIYDLTYESTFSAFDIFDDKNKRFDYISFVSFCSAYNIPSVPLLHIGQPISLKNAIKLLGAGRYGKPERPEGVVYRMERELTIDFLAKWVRSDKEDGKYMEQRIKNKGAFSE